MGKPMPDEIRAILRAKQDPALAVSCDHCGAAANRRCRLRRSLRLMEVPHPSRRDKAVASGAPS
jgi:hypothetical protein